MEKNKINDTSWKLIIIGGFACSLKKIKNALLDFALDQEDIHKYKACREVRH